MVNKQKGMTFIGLVLVIAVVIFLAIIGMKMVPAYIEFFGVKKAIQRIASDDNFNAIPPPDPAAAAPSPPGTDASAHPFGDPRPSVNP